MIHFSNKKFGFTIFIFLFLLCCTQEETNFHKQDNEKKEIESFFEISQIKSRSDNKHNDLVDIIKQCLLKQENIIGAIRFYKERYGTPLWQHAIILSTEYGFQIYIPVYKQNENEINNIWNFGIYNNKLYHFTEKRKENLQHVEEFWKFDYFTYHALDKEPKSGLKFHKESRAVYKCVHAYITTGEGENAHTEPKGTHCWQIDEKEFLESVQEENGNSNGGFTYGTDIGENNGGGGGGNSSSSNNSNSNMSNIDYKK